MKNEFDVSCELLRSLGFDRNNVDREKEGLYYYTDAPYNASRLISVDKDTTIEKTINSLIELGYQKELINTELSKIK